MVEVVSGVGMCVGVDGADNRGDGVVSSGGNVGVAGGGARWRDCCRFPDEILLAMSFVDRPGRKRWLRWFSHLLTDVLGGVWESKARMVY